MNPWYDFGLWLTCSVAAASAKSLSEMNPMVSIAARQGPALPSKEIAQDYDVVLIVGKPLGSLVVWDTICRDNNVKFFAAASRGTQAFFFSDLGEHSYQPPVSPSIFCPAAKLRSPMAEEINAQTLSTVK